METVHDKEVSKPSNFKGAPMVTTFIRSAQTKIQKDFVEATSLGEGKL